MCFLQVRAYSKGRDKEMGVGKGGGVSYSYGSFCRHLVGVFSLLTESSVHFMIVLGTVA